MKSPITTFHGIAGIVALVLAGAALHWLGVDSATTAIAMSLIGTALVGMGLMHGADQQTVDDVLSKVNALEDVIKKDVSFAPSVPVAQPVTAPEPVKPSTTHQL